MNTIQELLNNGFDKSTAISMLNNYENRIGAEYGCWRLMDINYDFEKRCQMWTFKCVLCGTIKTVKRPKLRDVATTCRCEKSPKIKKEVKKIVRNNDSLYLGRKYGNDRVIGFKKYGNGYQWVCECQLCGNTHLRVPAELRNGIAPECICQSIARRCEDFIGQKRNYLEVIGVDRNISNHPYLVCMCDCGNIHKVQPYFWEHGKVKSCGCMHDILCSESRSVLEHTEDLDRLRRIYNGMKQRCYNPNTSNYFDYGGRGIRICRDWIDDREEFIKWALSHGYSNKLSIDRIDVDGNYEPSNCRWADAKIQRSNQRPRKSYKKRVYWTINDVSMPAREWCRLHNVSYETVMYRVNQKGMTIEQALFSPKLTNGRPRKVDL